MFYVKCSSKWKKNKRHDLKVEEGSDWLWNIHFCKYGCAWNILQSFTMLLLMHPAATFEHKNLKYICKIPISQCIASLYHVFDDQQLLEKNAKIKWVFHAWAWFIWCVFQQKFILFLLINLRLPALKICWSNKAS